VRAVAEFSQVRTVQNNSVRSVTCSSSNNGRPFILFDEGRRKVNQANPVFSPLIAGGALYALSQLPEAAVRA
jgi:hypothetical protein